MENAASLTSGPDGKKRRVSYFYNAIGEYRYGEYRYGEGNIWEPIQIRMTHTLIRSYHLQRHMEILPPNLAGVSDFSQFHSPEYIQFLASVTAEYVASTRLGTITDTSHKRFNVDLWNCPVSDGLYDHCRAYAGGTISAAVKLNRQDADIAINWSGGMHRAKRDKSCGFGYINDVVLGILELLKVFKRVLYIDIGFHHGDAVQEAFENTDRVMTISFHKYEEHPHQRTGDITDCGPVGEGQYYSLNAPLKNGLDDATFNNLFVPVIHKAMEVYQPEAVVLQCGADSLTDDLLGKFNLSIEGHATCLGYIRSFNVPLMVLGGEGQTVLNVVRCWCYETAVAVGEKLDQDLPLDEYYEYYAPDYKLLIRPYPMMNLNNHNHIATIKNRLLMQLSQIIHAPSVQFQDTPSISQVTEAAEVDMETRQNRRILTGSPSYESDSDEDWCFLG